MITREQLAELRVGDVVEVAWPSGTTLRGPLCTKFEDWLYLGPVLIRTSDGWKAGEGSASLREASLTVISRAPRPLYVNHPRTGPAPGDVVRDADTDDPRTWCLLGGTAHQTWMSNGAVFSARSMLPDRLRLLVDGETGRCVP